MSKVEELANSAQYLRDNETFKDVVAKIKERQVGRFLDAESSSETREKAHVIIRALAEIELEIDARMADAEFEKHKERHRGQHD